MKTIGIFPASGGLGGSTYTHLLSMVPNDKVTLISRFPEKVPKTYTERGTVLRKASYESSPEDLEKAFAGIEVLFLISYPAYVHEYRVKVQLPAIDAARRAGVKHIFYSSLGFDGKFTGKSAAVVMHAHLDTEAYLAKLAAEDESFTYTSIREGLYSESFDLYLGHFDLSNPGHEILIPHDGSGPGVSWVKRDELGEATARLIKEYAERPEEFKYVNKRVAFTGNRDWSLEETAALMGRIAGKDIKIQKVYLETYASQPKVLAYYGTKEDALAWATAWEGIRSGETAVVSPVLEEVLGRRPEEFDVTVRAMGKDHGRAGTGSSW